MTPISGIIIKSTDVELVVQLNTGMRITAPPEPSYRYGSKVFVMWDHTKGRLAQVVTLNDIEMIDHRDNEPEGGLVEFPDEDDGLDVGNMF